LEWLYREIGYLERAIDAAEEFSDLGNPETLQVRSRKKGVFEERSA
jgi:hypothetical protein